MRATTLAALAVLALLPTAQGFTSVPPGSSVHDEVTAIAADAGWSAGAVEALQQAVREPDYQESEIDPDGSDVGRIDAAAAYRPEHHCDRVPGTSDAAAFEATVRYVQAQRADALAKAAADDPDGAMAALGRALHALQDCYSHSNIVDLPDQQAAHEQALLRNGSAVPGLRLVSYQPGADDPEDPAGDDYTHKDHAKDEAGKNDDADRVLADNRTAFEHAVELARLATVAFLQEATQPMAPGDRAALLDVREEDGGLPDDVNVPAVSVSALVVAVSAVAVLRRRWP